MFWPFSKLRENRYKGENTVVLNNDLYTIVFDWNALTRLRELFDNDTGVWKDLRFVQPSVLAEVLEIALAKHHPEVTKEFVMDASPPLVPLIKALDRAIELSYYGADGKPEVLPAAANAAESNKKKT